MPRWYHSAKGSMRQLRGSFAVSRQGKLICSVCCAMSRQVLVYDEALAALHKTDVEVIHEHVLGPVLAITVDFSDST